jgi:FkbM family methyltransferase
MQLLEKIFNLINKYYHFKRINSYINKLKINNIIDVGFHKGEFYETLHLKKIKYYAFEANPKIYDYSKKKFYNNKELKIFNICISDKVRNVRFYISNLTATSSLYKDPKLYGFLKKLCFVKKKFHINLQTRSLDQVLIKNRVNLKNSLLKIDVEGAEYLVLKGVKNNLNKISYLILEKKFFLKKRYKKINSFLISNNFILIKKFIYPLLNFEDRLYKNKSI